MGKFSHFNKQGRAKMVDISEKQVTKREATARTSIKVDKLIYEQIKHEKVKKGDVLAVAQVAGIMAAKNTAQWIPMCHPLSLTGVDITFDWKKSSEKAPYEYELFIDVTVKTKGSTGVEMEALTAASATALTIYDMCKAVDKGMVIGETYLISKSGGKSGDYVRE